MAQELDNSKGKSTTKFNIEETPVETVVVGVAKVAPDYDDEDEDELDVEQSDEDADDADDADEDLDALLEDSDEEEVASKSVRPSKENRKIRALKREANKSNKKIAELELKLAEKAETNKESELASEYLNDGYDEKEATKRAKIDIRQSNLEKQLDLLMFEKNNRKILAKYPDSENDLETIIETAKTGKMTVEQICRGLYGTDVPAKERRAVAALLEDGEDTSSNSVSKSMRTAATPTRSVLNREQLAAKRYIEKRHNKTMTEKEFLDIYPS